MHADEADAASHARPERLFKAFRPLPGDLPVCSCTGCQGQRSCRMSLLSRAAASPPPPLCPAAHLQQRVPLLHADGVVLLQRPPHVHRERIQLLGPAVQHGLAVLEAGGRDGVEEEAGGGSGDDRHAVPASHQVAHHLDHARGVA